MKAEKIEKEYLTFMCSSTLSNPFGWNVEGFPAWMV